MTSPLIALANVTPQKIAEARRLIATWQLAGAALELVRRRELRELDGPKAIALLTGPSDYTRPPRCPRESSGLVEQQRWFARARSHA